MLVCFQSRAYAREPCPRKNLTEAQEEIRLDFVPLSFAPSAVKGFVFLDSPVTRCPDLFQINFQ